MTTSPASPVPGFPSPPSSSLSQRAVRTALSAAGGAAGVLVRPGARPSGLDLSRTDLYELAGARVRRHEARGRRVGRIERLLARLNPPPGSRTYDRCLNALRLAHSRVRESHYELVVSVTEGLILRRDLETFRTRRLGVGACLVERRPARV